MDDHLIHSFENDFYHLQVVYLLLINVKNPVIIALKINTFYFNLVILYFTLCLLLFSRLFCDLNPLIKI